MMNFTNTIQQLIESGSISSSLRKASGHSINTMVLQEGLHNLGFSKALGGNKKGASGIYDAKTAEAVKQFAERNGIISTGEKVSVALGKLMIKRYEFLDELRHLYDAAQDPKLLKAISQGSSAKVSIMVLQTILHELGYDEELNWNTYGADGDYGPSTVRAVKAFAEDSGIDSNGKRINKALVKKTLATFAGYYGSTWYKESIMVETENLSINESNKRVLVSDGTSSKEFVKYKRGMYTSGTQKTRSFINANRSALKKLGLTESAMNVMVAVSENEGNLDAINTWDNAILTFGMFQWTVGQGESQGELPSLIKKIKDADPNAFHQYFGQHGLDVSPKTSATNGYFTLNGGMLKKQGSKEVLRTPKWAFYFWKAGQDKIVQSIEVQHALSRINRFYRSPGFQVAGHNIADVISSEYGVGLLLDNHVNRPGYLKNCVQKAVEKVGLAGKNPSKWNTKDESKIIQAYLKIRETYGKWPMTDAAKRARVTRKYVDKGIISAKRGSFKLGQ